MSEEEYRRQTEALWRDYAEQQRWRATRPWLARAWLVRERAGAAAGY